MLKHANEEREGALLRRLKEVGQRASARPSGFGFATGVEEQARRRPLAVVARVGAGSQLASDVRALAEAGVDGIEIAVRGDTSGVAAAIGAVQVPCGIFLANTSDTIGGTAGLDGIDGLDWIHLAPTAPAHLLGGKGPTRLISLSPDLPPGRLPGLAGLHADAVVVDGSGTFTVETFLALRTIEGATKGPLLAATSLGLTPDDAQVLYDHGIEGVLCTGGAGEARAFIAAIERIEK